MTASRIKPLASSALDPDTRAMMAEGEKMMGFMPNDGLTMARVPGLVGAMLDLTGVIYRPGLVDIETKRLVAVMNSSAAGCNYCRGHTLFGALRQGIGREKLDAIWAYETSEVFTPAERSALRIAHLSALQPNQVEDRHFEDLKQYYTEDQAAEIIAVIALFGFLYRWNDTIKTELEDQPARTALAD